MLKSEQSNETNWFLLPQEPADETQHTPIQKRIFQELIASQKLEQLNPQDNQDSRKQFLSKFPWADPTLDTKTRKALEELFVEFHNKFDKGINNDFRVNLTPIDKKPADSQTLPTPINLKEGITLELASLLKYGIINTLPFS